FRGRCILHFGRLGRFPAALRRAPGPHLPVRSEVPILKTQCARPARKRALPEIAAPFFLFRRISSHATPAKPHLPIDAILCARRAPPSGRSLRAVWRECCHSSFAVAVVEAVIDRQTLHGAASTILSRIPFPSTN